MRLFHFKSRTIFSIFRLGDAHKTKFGFWFSFFFLLSFFLTFFSSLVSLSVALYLRDTLVLLDGYSCPSFHSTNKDRSLV